MMRVRMEFVDAGFAGVLASPGTVAELAALAARRKAALERREGVPYQIRQGRAWDGRPRVIVSPARPLPRMGRVEGLTHEQWINDIWPKAGGPKYRRRS